MGRSPAPGRAAAGRTGLRRFAASPWLATITTALMLTAATALSAPAAASAYENSPSHQERPASVQPRGEDAPPIPGDEDPRAEPQRPCGVESAQIFACPDGTCRCEDGGCHQDCCPPGMARP